MIRKPTDREDGRLEPHNNHLIGVWMPDSFIDQRERSNEELKSKGRIERVMQWGSKVERVFSLAKHLQGNGQPAFGRSALISSIHR